MLGGRRTSSASNMRRRAGKSAETSIPSRYIYHREYVDITGISTHSDNHTNTSRGAYVDHAADEPNLHTCPMPELAYVSNARTFCIRVQCQNLHTILGRCMPAPATPVACRCRRHPTPTGVAVAANERYMWRVVTVRLISNFITKSVMKYYVLLRARDDVTSDMYGTNTQIVQRRTASPEIVKPVRELA